MKTKKVKGFTLIELIVVIAIIGVLAAILVPAMLGYVRKSKISAANSAAGSLFKAWNTLLAELDEEGFDSSSLGSVTGAKGKVSTIATASTASTVTAAVVEPKLQSYFKDVSKLKGTGAWCAKLEDGSCVAAAVELDGTYTGTHPAGIVTPQTYKTYKADAAKALAAAVLKEAGTT